MLPCLNILQVAVLGVTGKEKEGSLVIRAWLKGLLGFQGWLDKLNSKQIVGRCFTLWRERVGEIQLSLIHISEPTRPY